MNRKPIDFITDWDECPMCEVYVKPPHYEIPSNTYYRCKFSPKKLAQKACNIIDYQICPVANKRELNENLQMR